MKSSNPLANPCPGCGGPSKVRSSRPVTPIFRTVYLVCNDIECGCTFVGALEITHVVSPSSRARPRIALPFRPNLQNQPTRIPAGVAAGIMDGAANDRRGDATVSTAP